VTLTEHLDAIAADPAPKQEKLFALLLRAVAVADAGTIVADGRLMTKGEWSALCSIVFDKVRR
jgi:hypothetical protein